MKGVKGIDKDFRGVVRMLETYRSEIKEKINEVFYLIQELTRIYAALSQALPDYEPTKIQAEVKLKSSAPA